MNENAESVLIKKASRYLLARDLWLILLVTLHAIILYDMLDEVRVYIPICIALLGALWFTYSARYILTVVKASKDPYAKQAFHDEFFQTIKVKSSMHGFTVMLLFGVLLVLLAVTLDQLGVNTEVPTALPVESILLSGVIASDISKIIQSRG